MNPFNLQVPKANNDQTSTTTENASDLLREHNYDPAVKDALLQAAQAEQAKQQATHMTEEPEPVEPPDDTVPNMHREIMIIPDFMTPEICDEYIEYISQAPEVDLSVFDPDATNATGAVSWEVDKKVRDTQTVDITPIKDAVLDLMKHAVRDFLNPYYDVQIKDSEMPQVLVYHPGGHYHPHIDAEALFNDGSGQLRWAKSVDRDISLVVYLNDDYEGGEIMFPKQAISIKPKKGMMIAFPSTHHFVHGVNPVISGHRMALVNWFSLGITPVQQ